MLRLNFLPMAATTRRFFLAGAAAFAVAPVLATAAVQPDFDVVIVGAGAAGIAAARRIAQLDANMWFWKRVTAGAAAASPTCEPSTFLMSAGRVRFTCPMTIPWRRSRSRPGLTSILRRSAPRLRVGRRNAREGEMEDFLANLLRCNRAISDATTRGKVDVSCAQALPKDLGDWGRPSNSCSATPRAARRSATSRPGFRQIRRTRGCRGLPAGT